MTKEKKQEYTLRITQANKSELVVILYEMLECYISDAKEAFDNGNRAEFHDYIIKCTGCVRELTSSVIKENPIAGNLYSLYIYCNKELAKADIHFSTVELEHVNMVIGKLHDAYSKAAQNDDSESIMGNAQTVYAGLTYGKESLLVHLNSDMNRGYRV